jgi:hypothetical protein
MDAVRNVIASDTPALDHSQRRGCINMHLFGDRGAVGGVHSAECEAFLMYFAEVAWPNTPL